MIAQKIVNNKIVFITMITALAVLHVLLEHYSGGVITHHLLAREDLPGISNWWGILTIPILTTICIFLVDKRIKKIDRTTLELKNELSRIPKRFLGALCFGVLLSVLWETGQENILQYLIYIPLLLSLFFKISFPETFLGFVIGMTFTFGGILPMIIGSVLLILSFLIWIVFRKGIPFIFQKAFK